MTDSLSVAVHDFTSHVLMSFSVDETLLPWYVNLSTNFREPPFSVEMLPLIKALVLYFVCVDMEAYATSCPFQTM